MWGYAQRPAAMPAATWDRHLMSPGNLIRCPLVQCPPGHPDVRWITAEEFPEIGCTVIETDSGRAALAMIERDEPCDLMVVDLMMPGLSGIDTVRLARRTRPALKALFVSGHADRSRFEGELVNDVVLKKPFELETLVAAVQTALHPKPDNVVPLRRELYIADARADRP